MVAKKVLLSTTPTATTSTYFSEKLRAFYPQDIAKDEDGNLLIGVETVQPFNPITGETNLPVKVYGNYGGTPTAVSSVQLPNTVGGSNYGLVTSSLMMAYNPGTGVSDPVRTPTTWKWAACTTVAATDVWTPAGGKKFRVMGGVIWPSAGLAAAGVETIDLQEETLGTFGLKFQTYCPIAASVAAQAPLHFDLRPNGYLATTADKKLQVVLGTAATAGAISVSVWGTEE